MSELKALDAHIANLLKSLDDLEKSVISDEQLEELLKEAFRALEVIFDGADETLVKVLQEELKVAHEGEDWMKKFLSIGYKEHDIQVDKLITTQHAAKHKDRIEIYRYSLLSRYLQHFGHEVTELQALQKKYEGRRSIAQLYPNHQPKDEQERQELIHYKEELIRDVERIIELLQSFLEELLRNKRTILKDKQYEWSVINILIHELTHHIFDTTFQATNNTFVKRGLNEGWAHVTQIFSFLYEEQFFTVKTIKEKIEQMREILKKRKKQVYAKDSVELLVENVRSRQDLSEEEKHQEIERIEKDRDLLGRISNYDFMQIAVPILTVLLIEDAYCRRLEKGVDLKGLLAKGDLMILHQVALKRLHDISNSELRMLLERELKRGKNSKRDLRKFAEGNMKKQLAHSKTKSIAELPQYLVRVLSDAYMLEHFLGSKKGWMKKVLRAVQERLKSVGETEEDATEHEIEALQRVEEKIRNTIKKTHDAEEELRQR